MATIKSEYYRFNGVSWDIHYFKTTTDMVDGLNTALDEKANKLNASLQNTATLTGGHSDTSFQLYFPGTSPGVNVAFMGLWASEPGKTYDGVGIGQNLVHRPYGSNNEGGIFDLTKDASFVRFNYGEVVAGHRLTDGVLRELVLLNAGGHTILAGNLTVPGSVVLANLVQDTRLQTGNNQLFNADSSAIYMGNTATPMYIEGNALYYNSGTYGVKAIWHAGNLPNPVKGTISLGIGADFNTVIASGFYRFESGYSNGPSDTVAYGQLIVSHGEDTIYQMIAQHSTGNIYTRTGWAIYNGSTQQYWTAWKKLLHAETLPLALTNLNQTLEIGSATQYIRLAYAGKSQAFIKHGGGTEYEVWTAGNFNPSDYLSLASGGTITGAVSFNNIVYFTYGITVPSVYTDTITSDIGHVVFSGLDYVDFDLSSLKNVADPIAAGDAVNKGYLDARVTLPDAYTVRLQKDFIELESATDLFRLSDEGIPTLRCGVAGDGGFEISGNLSTTLDIYTRGKKVVTEGSIAAKTANYTFVLGDASGFIYSNSTSALTFTIPLNSSVAYPTGTEIHIMRYGTGEISISPTSGVTLVSEGSKRRINAQYQAASLKKLDTNTWVLIGALKT